MGVKTPVWNVPFITVAGRLNEVLLNDNFARIDAIIGETTSNDLTSILPAFGNPGETILVNQGSRGFFGYDTGTNWLLISPPNGSIRRAQQWYELATAWEPITKTSLLRSTTDFVIPVSPTVVTPQWDSSTQNDLNLTLGVSSIPLDPGLYQFHASIEIPVDVLTNTLEIRLEDTTNTIPYGQETWNADNTVKTGQTVAGGFLLDAAANIQVDLRASGSTVSITTATDPVLLSITKVAG